MRGKVVSYAIIAILAFSIAVAGCGPNAEDHYKKGGQYYSQGKLDEAIAEYKEAIRITPDRAEAHYNLGSAYAKQGRVDEAIAEYETYLRLWPDAPDRAEVEQEIAKLKGQ